MDGVVGTFLKLKTYPELNRFLYDGAYLHVSSSFNKFRWKILSEIPYSDLPLYVNHPEEIFRKMVLDRLKEGDIMITFLELKTKEDLINFHRRGYDNHISYEGFCEWVTSKLSIFDLPIHIHHPCGIFRGALSSKLRGYGLQGYGK